MFGLRNIHLARTAPKHAFEPFGIGQRRLFWEYVNMMFNKPDLERIKQFGPNRTCAEWVLRNGGAVVWSNHQRQTDYNLLPSEQQEVPALLEIDGTNSSISHYGFSHLIGCTGLKKITLHNCSYIDNRAMKGLAHGKESLRHVQVSKCADVTDAGIRDLNALNKLQRLILFDLISVEDIEECKQYLKAQLPDCQISEEAEQNL